MLRALQRPWGIMHQNTHRLRMIVDFPKHLLFSILVPFFLGLFNAVSIVGSRILESITTSQSAFKFQITTIVERC